MNVCAICATSVRTRPLYLYVNEEFTCSPCFAWIYNVTEWLKTRSAKDSEALKRCLPEKKSGGPR